MVFILDVSRLSQIESSDLRRCVFLQKISTEPVGREASNGVSSNFLHFHHFPTHFADTHNIIYQLFSALAESLLPCSSHQDNCSNVFFEASRRYPVSFLHSAACLEMLPPTQIYQRLWTYILRIIGSTDFHLSLVLKLFARVFTVSSAVSLTKVAQRAVTQFSKRFCSSHFTVPPSIIAHIALSLSRIHSRHIFAISSFNWIILLLPLFYWFVVWDWCIWLTSSAILTHIFLSHRIDQGSSSVATGLAELDTLARIVSVYPMIATFLIISPASVRSNWLRIISNPFAHLYFSGYRTCIFCQHMVGHAVKPFELISNLYIITLISVFWISVSTHYRISFQLGLLRHVMLIENILNSAKRKITIFMRMVIAQMEQKNLDLHFSSNRLSRDNSIFIIE